MIKKISLLYEQYIIRYPVMVLIVLSIILMASLTNINNFKLDASADTLILEDDKDLNLFREINDIGDIKIYVAYPFESIEPIPDDPFLKLKSKFSNNPRCKVVRKVFILSEDGFMTDTGLIPNAFTSPRSCNELL